MWNSPGTLMTSLAGVSLTWLVQSTALLVLGLVAGRLVKSAGAAVQSGVYRTTLAAVLVCPIASAIVTAAGYDGLTIQLPIPKADKAPLANTGAVASLASTVVPAMSEREPLTAVVDHAEPPPRLANETQREPIGPTETVTSPPAATSLSPHETVTAIVFTVWLLGAVVMGARLVVGHRRMTGLRATAVPAEPGAEELCRDLATRIGVGAPAVLRSPFLFSPCLDGLRRPVILLPEDAGENLLETFVHELAHLARRDGLWNLVRRSSVAVLWVQPLLWTLSRRLEGVAEEVCDDFVVQFGADPARYAGHLLELAERALPPLAPAGVGMVSLRSMLARRIVRLLDTSRSLSTRAGTRAVLAMLVVGLAGTLFVGLLGVGSGRSEVLAQEAETKAVTNSEAIRGQIVGPDGKPVPGAKITAWRQRAGVPPERFGSKSNSDRMRRYEYVRKTADADGRFEVTFGPQEVELTAGGHAGGMDVIATAPGFGLGYYLKDQPIRLSAGDQPVNGRLVDLEGRPVAGARVRIFHIWVPDTEARRAADARSGPYEFPFAKSMGVEGEPFLPGGVVTDADGRFRIEGLGRDVMTLLEVVGPKVAYKRFRVISRAQGPIAGERRESGSDRLVLTTTFGATCTVSVEPTRPIEGIVRDIETKQPIPGAIVTVHRLSGSHFGIAGLIQTETDAEGRYRLVGLPKEGAEGHRLAVYPPIDRPYFVTNDIVVPAAPGFEPVTRDIALRRGTWMSGKVTDIKTGEPVTNALIDYFPMLSNEHAKDYPNFDPAITGSVAVKTNFRTDKGGRFRMVALHGRGVVTVRVEFGAYRTGFGAEAIKGRSDREQLMTYDHIYTSMYNGLKEVDIPEGSASFSCDVPLDPGGSLKVRLVDPAGKPVTTASVTGRLADSIDLTSDMRGESIAKVSGLEPGERRTLVARESVRKIGAVLTVPPDGSKDGDEITLTLRPNGSVTGRVVDEAGKPAAGYIQVRHVPTVRQFHGEINIADVKVDADGRFRCDELPTGGSYRIWLINREGGMARVRMKSDPFQPFELAEKLNVEPGQVVDLGTFDVTTGKRVQTPVAQAGLADVPIAGRIVDLEGRPVAGVSVTVGSVHGPKTGDLTAWIDAVTKGAPPWTAYGHLGANVKIPEAFRRDYTTDNDGRFRIVGLGRERVVKLNFKGDTVAFTSIDVVTRTTERFRAPGFPDTHGPGAQTVYGADFTYTSNPGRLIEGVVRDARTKRPMAGVSVHSWRFAGSDFVDTRQLKTVSDANGRFRLVGMPKGKGNIVIAVPNDDQPYFMREASVGDPPGIGPVPVEIELHRGVMITGKITDKATGKPVADARLHYLPFLENTFVQAFPEFDKDGNVEGFQTRYTTGADGTYKLVGMAGRAIVGVEGIGTTPYRSGVGTETIKGLDKNGNYNTWHNPIWPGKSWPHTLVEINPREGTETVTVDAQLDPGLSLRIRVVDADGKPVPEASVANGSHMRAGESTADAVFTLSSFRPDEVRNVVVRHEPRSLGKVVRLRAGGDVSGPVVIAMAPTATIKGRVVDADGNPVPSATVRVDVEPTEGFLHQFANVVADRDGRFEVLKVPAGCEYGLVAESGTMIKQRQVAFGKATVKPGETTDVGEIRFKND
jgi:beta-lactamase regulating signal transducer with metallopeptidase domain/protocatechuate 3,4-dioxygenase beta subunit